MKSRAKDRDRACLGSDFRFQGGLGNVFVGRPGGGGKCWLRDEILGCNIDEILETRRWFK